MIWTKPDIRQLQGWLDLWALYWRPLDADGFLPNLERLELWRKLVDTASAEKRRSVLVQNAENHVALHRHRQESHEATAEHARKSGVWGGATSELVSRFTLLAIAECKKRAKVERLLERLRSADPLPVEILDYRPVAK